MKRWGHLKPVRFDEKELKTDLGEGNFIFVGSSCDMWAQDIPDEWIEKTLIQCDKFKNEYFIQSKNPSRFLGYDFPKYYSFCTTIETNRNYPMIMRNSPFVQERAEAISNLQETHAVYLTIEPIMDFDLIPFVDMIKIINPIQVNIGADSGNHKLPEPPLEKVLELIAELEKFTTIHNKSNLKRLLKGGSPKQILKTTYKAEKPIK
jgi:hypothetical protein